MNSTHSREFLLGVRIMLWVLASGMMLWTASGIRENFTAYVSIFAWPIATVFAIAIHLICIFAIRELVLGSGLLWRTFCIAVVMLCWSLSCVLSASFYWAAWNAQDYAESHFNGDLQALISPLYAFQQRYPDLAKHAADLAELSKAAADRENSDGKSCDGSSAGQGEIFTLRQNDKARFDLAAKYFASKANDLERIMKTLGDATAKFDLSRRNEIKSAVDVVQAQAIALRQDPEIESLRAYIVERQRKAREGIPAIRKRVQTTVYCRDAVLDQGMQSVLDSLSLPVLSGKPIEIFSGTRAASTGHLYEGLLNWIGSWMPNKSTKPKHKDSEPPREDAAGVTLSSNDMVAFVWPAIFESLVVVLVAFAAKHDHSGGSWLGAVSSMGGPPRRLKPEVLARLKEMAGGDAGLFGLISRHAIPVGKTMVYIYVPLASDNRDMVMRVFEVLSAARMLAFAIPVVSLAKRDRQYLQTALGSARDVRIFALNREMYRELLAEELKPGDSKWYEKLLATSRSPELVNAAASCA